jgi:hypothetical protein
MTDTLPEDAPELEPAVTFDSRRLIALVRRGDAAAIGEAYRLTFASDLGRTVLLHMLATIGEIGAPRAAETPEQSNHLNGRGFAVLKIAGLAGFDPVAISAAGMTQALEGARYEHGYGHDGGGKPGVIFGDDGPDGPDDGGGFDGGADDGSDRIETDGRDFRD